MKVFKKVNYKIILTEDESATLLGVLRNIIPEKTPIGFVTNKITINQQEADLLNDLRDTLTT
jgi:hypothetical protein